MSGVSVCDVMFLVFDYGEKWIGVVIGNVLMCLVCVFVVI